MKPVSTDHYAGSGVDTDAVQDALSRLVHELAPTQAFGAPSEVGVGHFAAVIRVGPLRIALTTDGVGTKLLVAQLAGRYDTVGIDCVGMNVNDLICVGARPVSMLDYIAVESADPEIFAQIGKGLAEGARQAGVSIVGGETALIRDMLKGAVPGRALDLVGMAIGVVEEGELLDGSAVQPGDCVIGVASNGLHSNGYSLARKALLGKFQLDQHIPEFGHTLADELLRPTMIYVPHVRALRDENVRIHSIAHITGDGLLNIRRVEAPVGFELVELPEPPPVFQMIERLSQVGRHEMRAVFNMGIGLTVTVPETERERALKVLRATGVEAWAIGHAVADPQRRVLIPAEGLVGHSRHFAKS